MSMKIKKQAILLSLVFILIIFIFNIVQQKDTSQSCLSLTFDDGYKTDYSTVVPLLKENDFKATFFLITSYYKSGQSYLLNKSDIKEIIQEGHEIGSHTISHLYLDNMSTEEIYQEIVASKINMEEDFNISISSFAFPYSDYNRRTLNLAREHYDNIRFHDYALTNETDIDKICTKINKAQKKGKNIVILFHDISETPNYWGTSIENFEKIIDCIRKSNIIVDTLDGCNNRK